MSLDRDGVEPRVGPLDGDEASCARRERAGGRVDALARTRRPLERSTVSEHPDPPVDHAFVWSLPEDETVAGGLEHCELRSRPCAQKIVRVALERAVEYDVESGREQGQGGGDCGEDREQEPPSNAVHERSPHRSE